MEVCLPQSVSIINYQRLLDQQICPSLQCDCAESKHKINYGNVLQGKMSNRGSQSNILGTHVAVFKGRTSVKFLKVITSLKSVPIEKKCTPWMTHIMELTLSLNRCHNQSRARKNLSECIKE